MEDFLEWLGSNRPVTKDDPFYSLLRLVSYVEQGGRGLLSRSIIPAGSCCLSIPIEDPRLVLTPDRCVEYLNRCGCFESTTRTRLSCVVEPLDCLVLFLFHVSLCTICPLHPIWKPYMHVLPENYPNPIYGSYIYSTYCIIKFYSHDLYLKFHEVRNRLFETWHRLHPILKYHTYDGTTPPAQFVWAWSTVNSRCVYCSVADSGRMGVQHLANKLNLPRRVSYLNPVLKVASQGDSHSVALMPFFDFLNHSANVTCRLIVNDKNKTVQLFVDQDIMAGEQVFINYGAHDNLTLLIEYGFSLRDNPNDAVFPSSADFLAVIPGLTFTDLDMVLSRLRLQPMSDSEYPIIWPTVCFSHTGPSFHLLLLSYALTSLPANSWTGVNCEDSVTPVDWSNIYELNEDWLFEKCRLVLVQLVGELSLQQQKDYLRVLDQIRLVPHSHHNVLEYLETLKEFLLIREELLTKIQLNLTCS